MTFRDAKRSRFRRARRLDSRGNERANRHAARRHFFSIFFFVDGAR
jgi:hypothetical protein